MPELTHDELNRGIAELLGWTSFREDGDSGPRVWVSPDRKPHYRLPHFAGSLDALQEAERGLIERGWGFRSQRNPQDGEFTMLWYRPSELHDDPGEPVHPGAWAPSESEARARALYAALKAEKEAGE